MSFTTKENIQRLIEGLLNHVWPEDMGRIPIPFPEMTYKDAMKNYGVDKPDTRFDNLVIDTIFLWRKICFSKIDSLHYLKLQDVTELAKASEIFRIFGSSEIANFAAIAMVFKSSSVTCRINISVINNATDILFLTALLHRLWFQKVPRSHFLNLQKWPPIKLNCRLFSFACKMGTNGNRRWPKNLHKRPWTP